MKLLKVPYIAQFNSNACGAAVLQMIYEYYGLQDVSQEILFNTYQELEPRGSGNLRMTTDALVQDSRERGFNSGWSRVNYSSNEDSINLLKILVLKNKIPIIVCQKFTEDHPTIGHFRIVLGIDEGFVYLHDPNNEIGGPKLKWPINKFMDFWQWTGDNVTGGIFCYISK